MRSVFIFFNLYLLVCFSITGVAQVPFTDTIQWTGPENKRINIVILGDGYRDLELGKFSSDARQIIQALFQEEPYKSYAAFFNVVALPTASAVSGAARDPATLIDNFYGSTFNFAGIDRLLVPTKNWQIQSVLAQYFPAYDQVFMLVNDAKYGGSGGWIATSSTHSSAPEIAIHEIGHSFSKLSDEYFAGDQYLRETLNMTRETDPQKVRWKNWMGFAGTGIYQHCCGGNSGLWYRPHNDCKMRFLGKPFCSVCREATVVRIHQLASYLDDYSPKSDPLILEDDSVTLRVDLLYPAPNSLEIQWYFDEEAIPLHGIDSLVLQTAGYPDGTYEVVCSITDTTSLVRMEGFQSQVFKEVLWTLERNATSIHVTKVEGQEWKVSVFPNPAEKLLNISLNQPVTGTLDISLLSAQGLLMVRDKVEVLDQQQAYLDLPTLSAGIYQLVVRYNQRTIGLGKVVIGGE
jgi:hypothetical protein